MSMDNLHISMAVNYYFDGGHVANGSAEASVFSDAYHSCNLYIAKASAKIKIIFNGH